jgi:hypothetical protein
VLDYLSNIEQKILPCKLFDKKLNLFYIKLQKLIKIRFKIKPIFYDFAEIVKINTDFQPEII